MKFENLDKGGGKMLGRRKTSFQEFVLIVSWIILGNIIGLIFLGLVWSPAFLLGWHTANVIKFILGIMIIFLAVIYGFIGLLCLIPDEFRRQDLFGLRAGVFVMGIVFTLESAGCFAWGITWVYQSVWQGFILKIF